MTNNQLAIIDQLITLYIRLPPDVRRVALRTREQMMTTENEQTELRKLQLQNEVLKRATERLKSLEKQNNQWYARIAELEEELGEQKLGERDTAIALQFVAAAGSALDGLQEMLSDES